MTERRVVVFGGSGQLGSACLRELRRIPAFYHRVETVSWSVLGGPSSTRAVAAIREALAARIKAGCNHDFVFANGLTDPWAPAGELEYCNRGFVEQVIEATRAFSGAKRYMSFGSIMENFPEVCAQNAYLSSKAKLGQRMAAGKRGELLHIRLHTLYGSAPHPHMFLGQIARALADGAPFRMSSGDQLREYHHVDDIAIAVAGLLERDRWDFGPVLEVSSGEPVRLADLARAIFKAFGKEGLLQVGAISRPSGENTEQVFERSPSWLLPASREPVAGVIHSLRSLKSG